MSNTVLFGKVKDPELVVYSFRGQLQWARNLENSCMDEKLRASEKGTRGDIGEGSPVSEHS